ncbi:TPA: alpha-D-ribose 1-methylphosphonate 5-triphosphate diphosphatase [Escherichia coli]
MQTIIRVEKLAKTFNQHQALHAVDLNIHHGEMVALLGPSGSGKSTLLRHLSGLITGDKSVGSHIELLGRTVQREGRLARDIRKSRAHTGYIFQQFNLVNRLSVLENVLIGALGSTPFWRTCFSWFTGEQKQRALQALTRVGMVHFAHQRVSTLSGGQQQRVAIAHALMQQAKVILADEPIASLDPESARIVMDTLRDINQNDGITTVLDAVAIGDVRDGGDRLENLEKMINAIEETQKRGVNRAEHRLHLRCELPHHTTLPLFEKLVQREPVTLVSLMDHSPGQRQFANREKYREYYQGKYSLTDAQMQQYEEEQLALAARWSQPNRESIAALCRARKIALASHDDATHAHVAESHQLGSVIAEFPTTFEAAEASRKHGMNVLMGAPNIVRGGSHSGNVAASELAQLGLLDILSSDYYPASLLDAAFRVADDQSNRFTLSQAVKLVTKNPAQALNLQDRGVISEGKRADLVLAHRKDNHIHIDHVWRQGKRVF